MSKKRGILILLLTLLAVSGLRAGEPPHIGYVYPAGGQVGTVFEILVGGKNLKDAFSANITGAGAYAQVLGDPDRDLETYKNEDLKANIVIINNSKYDNLDLSPSNLNFDKELTQKQKNKIEREKRRRKKNRKNDQFPDNIKLRMAIMDNCEPGEYELRVITPSGLSNKLTFLAGKLKEYNEVEPNNRKDQVSEIPSLPVLINGRILENDVDGFRFKAKKGMSLVIKTDVRKLLPYMADAVPGWFQASMTLYDSKGNDLTHADSFRFDQDPVLFYDVPEDGEYYLEVRDSIYRGREDFMYRVTIGELPFITRISPIGAGYDNNTVVSIFGKNLPVNKIEVCGKDRSSSTQYIQVEKEGLVSNKVPFGLSGLPEFNKIKSAAQEKPDQFVKLPVMLNGVIEAAGVKDYYSFEGKEGEQVYIEVIARRLCSPLDSIVTLYNSKGEKLGENDDDQTYKWDGVLTHHSDSGLAIKLPKNDTYTVMLTDVLNKGGEEYAYRMRLSRPQPDFELYSLPASVTVPRGGSGYFRIHALRKDGFNGPIKISLKNISNGFKLDDAVIPEGKNDIKVTISASFEVPEGLTLCNLEGFAVLPGRSAVYHEVTPAEEYTQAFAYKHIVPVNAQVVLIAPPMPFALSFSVPKGQIFELTQGKESKIGVEAVRRKGFNENIQLQLLEAPEGISIRNGYLRADKDKTTVIIRAEGKVPAGLFENLILSGVAGIPVEDKERPDNKLKRERLYVTAPALAVVVMKQGQQEKQEQQKQQRKKEKQEQQEQKKKEAKKVKQEKEELTKEKHPELSVEEKEVTKEQQGKQGK